jgi:beta-N-acetylhexosaminidase
MRFKKIVIKTARETRKYFFRLARKYYKRRYLWPAIKIFAVSIFLAIVAMEYFDSLKILPPVPESAPAPAVTENFDDKIGQMLMVGFRGTEALPDSYIAETVKNINLGGVILFDYDNPSKSAGRNIASPEQTKQLVADLKKYAGGAPLLVAVDAEGGRVNRLKPELGFINVPSAKDLGNAGVGAALESYWNLATQLSNLGFNINFGPVVDVNVNAKNPAIGALGRSYSAAPEKVIALARSFIAAHRSFNIITGLKHFPGHGSSESDSHLGLPDVTDTYDKKELLPYERLIKESAADSIMTAHIIDRDIDPDYPATLSPKFIQNILRDELGFDGVVFSDDMQMGAIVDNYGFEDAIIRAINAGCDILIFSNNGTNYDETVPYRARDIILKAVSDGRIAKDRINQAYGRIMELKEKI